MTRIIPLEAMKMAPTLETTLRTQGIPGDVAVPERVVLLADEARRLYEALCEPRGVLSEISFDDFQKVYRGEGKNSVPAPLPDIAGKAHRLALFAATIGEPVCKEINKLFQTNDPALGCMLDGIASERADRAATALGGAFLESVLSSGEAGGETSGETRVLPYSPGYCGWHVTGQRRLFSYLNPGQIDIHLSDSCLMSPLKSVSGVLVAGPAEIHAFDNDFEFCLDCANWECRERISSLTHPNLPEN